VTPKDSLWVDRERDADGGPFSSARWNRQAREARPPAGDTEPTPPPEPPRRRRALLPLAALATALVALAVGAFSLFADNDDAGSLPGAADSRPIPTAAAGRVYQTAGPGVVSVRAGSASGTGFVVRGDGTIVTNAHVVGDAQTATVRFNDSGRLVEADVLGTDPSSDLAALRVDPGSVDNLRPLPLADSEKVRVGDQVIAIGHPFGLDRTATQGIVSGVGREIQAPDGFQIEEAIQTDAPINPGNSGGPLLDVRGRVIGVNSQIATGGSQGNIGIGFAVSANTVRDVIPRLARGEKIERPYLGVTTTPDSRGAGVVEVAPAGPAAGAGVQAGDVITSVDGRSVSEPEDVSEAISGKEPGDQVRVELVRDGEPRSITITLGARPQRTP
jgi:putative serine protease PepD